MAHLSIRRISLPSSFMLGFFSEPGLNVFFFFLDGDDTVFLLPHLLLQQKKKKKKRVDAVRSGSSMMN